jgi:UDP-glucose 4-epimerase
MTEQTHQAPCVLVTGGAGYIGSHTLVSLVEAGYRPLVLDNFSNSARQAVERVGVLCGETPECIEGDIRDRSCLDDIFQRHPVTAVIHFAGLKSVGESVREPLRYYDNNVAGSVTLLQAMQAAGVDTLVFSSSATVYAPGVTMPVAEDAPLGPINPYGQSKLMVEQVIRDHCLAHPSFRAALLRYFNPTGAHPSGKLGESPRGTPENLVPYIAQVATGVRDALTVFGNDYDTVDGTGVRDYIHVMDLAEGHVHALDALRETTGAHTWNLGTGTGYSVLEMVRAYEKACGREIAYTVGERRPGDVGTCYACTRKAASELHWQASRDLEEMMRDNWRWQASQDA